MKKTSTSKKPATKYPLHKIGNKIISNCNECQRDSNQIILSVFTSGSPLPDKKYITYYAEHCTIQCQGCDTISYLTYSMSPGFQETEFKSEFPEQDHSPFGDYEYLSDDECYALPTFIYNLYKEVIVALENDAPILAGIGMRTLVEAVCLHQEISGKDLNTKINNLQVKGFISVKDLPLIHKLRMVGNVSAHQVKKFTDSQLDYALKAVNHLLKCVYYMPKVNDKIKEPKKKAVKAKS